MKIEGFFNKYYNLFIVNDKYICECIFNYKEDCIKFFIDEFVDKYYIFISVFFCFV